MSLKARIAKVERTRAVQGSGLVRFSINGRDPGPGEGRIVYVKSAVPEPDALPDHLKRQPC